MLAVESEIFFEIKKLGVVLYKYNVKEIRVNEIKVIKNSTLYFLYFFFLISLNIYNIVNIVKIITNKKL